MIGKYKTGKEYINQQYKNDNNLSKRIGIYKYNTNKYKWFNWVFDKLQIKEDIKVLELGCGNGLLWQENIHRIPKNIEITLSDISEGMLEKAKSKITNSNFRFKVIDAQSIPFIDNYFDIIIANHMLYHVKNIKNTLIEIRRTLKYSGLFYATTISKNNMKELKKWIDRFSLNIDYNPKKVAYNFGIENGKNILKKYFKKVELYEYFNEIKILEINPIIDYYESLAKIDGSVTDYSKVINHIKKILTDIGYITFKNIAGLFISRNLEC